jgi:hypothetical protein
MGTPEETRAVSRGERRLAAGYGRRYAERAVRELLARLRRGWAEEVMRMRADRGQRRNGGEMRLLYAAQYNTDWGEKGRYSRWGFRKYAMVLRVAPQTAIALPLSHANHEPKLYW